MSLALSLYMLAKFEWFLLSPFLLLLLPVAFAGLPPHHQEIVDRFEAENANLDNNVYNHSILYYMMIAID